jgi:hypothetical protein
MRKVDKFEKVNEENFKRVVGVKRSTFDNRPESSNYL